VRGPILTLLGLSAVFALGGRAPRVFGATACQPIGEIRFICDLNNPEDLAVVPGSEWIITSGNGVGGRLHLVSVRGKTATVLFPAPTRNERFDSKAYPTCPGPLDPDKQAAFRAHGLYLKPGQGGVHALYVVHHGIRESVEVFEVDARARPPALTWVGCAPEPSTIGPGNGVVALPDGGFAVTSGKTGDVWQWQARTGWSQVPGTEKSAPNGLEISKDGRWLYIAGWAEEKVTRVSRGQTPVQKDVIQLGFRPDNLRMSLDGSVLFAAGHTDKNGHSIVEPRDPLSETSNIAKIDPQTMAARRIFEHRAMDGFVASTTAIQIGNEMWLGSQRGDRIAYFPAPK
jgi:sugar lactone lactonase YvrE